MIIVGLFRATKSLIDYFINTTYGQNTIYIAIELK